MGLDILSLAPKSQWAFCEFLSKCFSLLTLFQSTWSLSVVTRPHLQTGSWSSCYRGSLFHIAVLLREWWRSGSVNLFWSLPLPLPLPLWPPLSLPLFLPFFPPLGEASLPFWECNGEKRSILSQGGGITFGAFG